MKTIIFIISAIFLMGCSQGRSHKVLEENKTLETNPGEVSFDAPAVGLQNLRQVFAVRQGVTGVIVNHQDTSNNSIKGIYENSRALYSMNGDPLALNASMILSIASLSSAFCQNALAVESSRSLNDRAVFRGIDLSTTPFSNGNAVEAATQLYLALIQTEPTEEEVNAIAESLKAVPSKNDALIVACTAILSSPLAITL